MNHSTGYILRFAAAICVVCSIFVAGAAVTLRPRQQDNQLLDRYQKVLGVSGLMQPNENLTRDEIKQRFDASVEAKIVELATGKYDDNIDAAAFDQRRAAKDLATSREAPDNAAKVLRLPHHAQVYLIKKAGVIDKIVLPVEGKGLWSTLYGYLALAGDARTIRGLTYYEHGETPGLGGEVDNPKWRRLWDGRQAFSPGSSEVSIRVIKGAAGPAQQDPHRVDGLSGATITSRGVTYMLQLWLGPDGFGPYLDRVGRAM